MRQMDKMRCAICAASMSAPFALSDQSACAFLRSGLSTFKHSRHANKLASMARKNAAHPAVAGNDTQGNDIVRRPERLRSSIREPTA